MKICFFGRTNEGSAGIMINHITDETEHIYLALGITDFRKQQNGLFSLVSLKFKLDPYSGASVFLFCNKRHNSLRALRWDGNGFILVTKDMKFKWPKSQGELRDITKHLFPLILGIIVFITEYDSIIPKLHV